MANITMQYLRRSSGRGKTGLRWFFVLAFLSGIASVRAEMRMENLLKMSLQELMAVEIPMRFASHQPVLPRYLSAAATAISAKDIPLRGRTTIPDVLQFAPGVNVQRFDQQRCIVGIQGSFGMFSDWSMVLMNGWSVMDPTFSTTHWEKLPIQMEDVDRIEIICGPGGAAWENTFSDVINIVTK
jgi:iron complex outermembrane receptor protein